MSVLSSGTTMSFLPAFFLGNQVTTELTLEKRRLVAGEVPVSGVPHCEERREAAYSGRDHLCFEGWR